MSSNSVVTAIDLGTDKCVTLIAKVNSETGALRVVGVSAIPSKGMRKSVIVDLEQVLTTISESLDAAERMAGFDVNSAYVSVSGAHIQSRNSKGVVAVASPDQEITSEDVARVIEAARAISLPSERQVIHVIPRDFKVDSQAGIKDPVGMTGVRLESEAHIITGMTTALRNLEKCINDLGLEVDAFVFAGLAASEVVLTETEKELGVVAVDIGAGSTSYCAFVEGSLEYSGSIPIGARHITQDIALGLRVSLDSAEKIKLALGKEYKMIKPRAGESKEELSRRRKKADQLDLEKLDIYDTAEAVSQKHVVERIMVPRMREIIQLVGQKLDEQHLLTQVPAGLVLTGGGAETVGIVEVAKRSMNMSARLGIPQELQGLVSDIKRPSYSNSIGLLVYGHKHGDHQPTKTSLSLANLKGLPIRSMVNRVGQLVKKLLP